MKIEKHNKFDLITLNHSSGNSILCPVHYICLNQITNDTRESYYIRFGSFNTFLFNDFNGDQTIKFNI